MTVHDINNPPEAEFDTEVLYFTAPWCAPCKALGPIVESLAELNSSIGFFKVDIDAPGNDEVAKTYDVSSVPTLVLIGDGGYGMPHKRLTGAQSARSVKRWLGLLD